MPALSLASVSAASRHLEVRYAVRVAIDRPVEARLREVAETLAVAAARGAFCAGVEYRGVSSMSLAETRVRESIVVQEMSSLGVDPRLFQCLRNMVRRLRNYGVEVTRVEVADLDRADSGNLQMPLPSEENEGTVYPAIAAPATTLQVAVDDIDFGKSRRCLVEFGQPLAPELVESFEAWVRPWYTLLEAGSYALPVGPPETTECIAGSVSQFDQSSIEVAVDVFLATEMAWNALVNMVDRFDGATGRVLRIVIE